MRRSVKVGAILTGYVGAFLVAFAVVSIYVALTDSPDRQASSGMYAFGDSLLFLAVFGVAAVIPTGAALYFLRPYRTFWVTLSVLTLAIAATGLAAALDYAIPPSTSGPSVSVWSALAPLRLLVAPLFALAFLLSTLFAPRRSVRIPLFAATVIETAAFAYFVLALVHRS